MPKVSVIIPTYNRAHLITEAILSVLAQAFIALEVIVVDDGSTDNTKEVVDCSKDPRIKYIHQKNHSASAARNTGIKASSGEYIAFLRIEMGNVGYNIATNPIRTAREAKLYR